MKRQILEFLGTFFVVLSASLTENPLAIGFVYLAMLYIGWRISGGHFNPGVTLALWLRGEFATHRIWSYWIAQLLGAFAALIFEFKLSGSLFIPDVTSTEQLFFIAGLELLFSFALCYVYLAVRTVPSLRDTHLYGLILGFTLIGLTSMGGLINAAIALSSLILNMLYHGEIEIHVFNNIMVYVVSPFVGAIAAGLSFDYLEAPARGEFLAVESAAERK